MDAHTQPPLRVHTTPRQVVLAGSIFGEDEEAKHEALRARRPALDVAKDRPLAPDPQCPEAPVSGGGDGALGGDDDDDDDDADEVDG